LFVFKVELGLPWKRITLIGVEEKLALGITPLGTYKESLENKVDLLF